MPQIDLISLRYGQETDWEATNPILMAGEPGVVIETGKMKIGNGTDPWNDLEFAQDGDQGDPGIDGDDGIVIGPTPPPTADSLWADTTTAGDGVYTGPPGPAGPAGTPGTPGAPGAPGAGVAVGGTAGQQLVKTSAADYATAWQSKPTFDVRDYGAVGDGATDDTAHIQAALDACGASGGGVVHVPCNDYMINATLLVPSYVSIEGTSLPFMSVEYGISGSNAMSTLAHGAGSFTMLKNSDPVNGNSSISISRLRFHATNEATASGTSPTIEFSKVRRSVLRDCHILGSPSSTNRLGMYIHTSSEHNGLFNCQFDTCGVAVENANRILVRECEIGAAGLSFTNGYANMVIDCDLYNDALPADTPFPAWPSIITMHLVKGALIQGNQLTHSSNDGIYLLDVQRCLVLGNEIKNSSRQIANVWAGIGLDSTAATPSTGNVIANNMCWDEVGYQAYGIRVLSSGGSTSNNLIVGNGFTGNTVAAAQQVAGAANVWRDNLGTLSGPAVASAAALTIPPGRDIVTVSGTTAITSIVAGYAGQRVTLVFTGALTFTDGSNLKLNANLVTTPDDTITLICDGTNWFETGRSVN